MIRSNVTFLSNLAVATVNLRELTKQNAVFKWTESHEKEFQNIKDTFTTDVLVRHYDTNKNTFIFFGTHFTGFCAILAQGKSIEQTKALALTSQTTTATEKKLLSARPGGNSY